MSEEIRNVAIVAHVDHGKTTLIDQILKYCRTLGERSEVAERFMDSDDLEKERGITIRSKNLAVRYKGVRINVIDTPGHADFGGEVERVLCLADAIVLLVDSVEGPMPQTRFVLKKAFEAKLKPLVFINKIDRPAARAMEVVDEVLNLFIELDASDEHLEFPVIYGSGRDGFVRTEPDSENLEMSHLMDFLLEHVPAPGFDESRPGAMRVTAIEYNEYIGKLGIGRVEQGVLKANDAVTAIRQSDGNSRKEKIRSMYTFEGIQKAETTLARAGDIVALAGINNVEIGDTITLEDPAQALAPVPIDEPTLSMEFRVNDSPFAGKEGEHLTSSKIKTRLQKELERNVALRVEPTEDSDTMLVSGRGMLHLSVLIENMRREGYELSVSRPRVITRKLDGVTHEPYLMVYIEVPEEFGGKMIECMASGSGELVSMATKREFTALEFRIPARGMIGMRPKLLTLSKGECIINSIFDSWKPMTAKIVARQTGSLISMATGDATAYALETAQERGSMFVKPGDPVYEGMVVGENAKDNDLVVNPVREKKLTNMRNANAEKSAKITPAISFSLEEALEFLAEDEMLECTPQSLRIRKTFLTEEGRKKAKRSGEALAS